MRTPREVYGELFEAVQRGRLFPDSKTFVDAVPKLPPHEIVQHYRDQRGRSQFDLGRFIRQHFELPESRYDALPLEGGADVRAGIERLWATLSRPADRASEYSSLIALPNAYVVPGGRFREMYYWDSYFTMLGLAASGRVQMLEDMVKNFASLIDRVGFVPNGTRTYYCTRSQPPLFVLMVELLAEVKGEPSEVDRYGAPLKAEYEFWMSGADELSLEEHAVRRVVRVRGARLNRHWDDAAEPRQESYREDTELAEKTARDPQSLFRDLRAACESGWDFSSRWFDRSQTFASIRTTEIVPIDLNCVMYRIESVLAGICERAGDVAAASHYRERAESRANAIRTLFFDRAEGFFYDIDAHTGRPTGVPTLAVVYPLFLGLANGEQAQRVAARLERDFLKPGGWVTTLSNTGQQWDAPNGWAPLQWVAFEGLRRYGFDALAREGARRWVETTTRMYHETGQFLEKYNVEQPDVLGGGGEYTVQDGFGWTNGVLLRLLEQGRAGGS